ncbi:MAG: metal-sulfur cluster assembly factor [Bacteroidetes bacterium]|nr:metal-sulfur cluster assembly factor [Bacteroidota bacterium]
MDTPGSTNEDKIYQLLKGVIDPELMVNIIDLGLVYEILCDEEKKLITVSMTLTSPGCPMGDVIQEDALQLVKKNYDHYEVKINLVWEPAWSPDFMSEEAKKQLG